MGASEVIVRPANREQLQSILGRHCESAARGNSDVAFAATEPVGNHTFFFSASLAMQKLRTQAELLAQSDVPVLILGEKGSGKRTVASLIHKLSVRSGFGLRRVQCSEVPASLLEREIFGDTSLSFSSVSADNSSSRSFPVRGPRAAFGDFAVGEKGTIFLDEITALPPALQARLMQVLRAAESPTSDGAQDVRILAGSSVNLEQAMVEKRLREDLYYRLSAFTVYVPPLRQRRDEIPLLLQHFMHRLAKHYRMPTRDFPAAVIQACQGHSWPGNLEEMETFVKRFLIAGDQQLPVGEGIESGTFEAAGFKKSEAIRHSPASAAAAMGTVAKGKLSTVAATKPESLKTLIQGIKSEAEQHAIRAALRRTGWNRKAAARLLSVSYRTLLYKIDQYQMRAPEPYLATPVAEFSLHSHSGEDDGTAN